MNDDTPATAQQKAMLDLHLEHVVAEMALDVERVMATLDDSPEYEFCGVALAGTAAIRRFYSALIEDIIPRVIGTNLRARSAGTDVLIDEGTMTLDLNDGLRPTWSFCSVISYENGRIKGERVYYADPEAVRFHRDWIASRNLAAVPS
ncbi:hypothetical protein [Streptomyces sp. NPDC004629]|uniref:hypothetical protein n=1 Tax=Streptomyces sp. NPDC004629 TaxID=3364705 RepID=UPI0036CBE1BD